MKKFILLLLLVFGSVSAQRTLDEYKIAVVPKKFDSLDEADKYRMNTFVKMYMEKYGFTTYFNDEIPIELANENCNKVYVNLKDDSSMLATKIRVEIRDCTNAVLFTSDEGTSRAKENKVAYPTALRAAFSSFDRANYKYRETQPAVVAVPATPAVAAIPVSPAGNNSTSGAAPDLLFAQPVASGFQLVDTTPKVVLKLKNTSMPNVFIAERDNLNGVMFQQNGKWIFEFYKDGKLYSETMNVKF